ncbi:Hypothetical protein NTJ_02487 [Nesidiocoris tenuis]|uniref:Uncharacterized protein n=1 Tax=Nesidiocoris tenuis TaxID=355587 RepID=A0ABN7ABI4_9HEMI|nr:Hypothetical protein NTJ_02487 [Nesidiocoris tenuis]
MKLLRESFNRSRKGTARWREKGRKERSHQGKSTWEHSDGTGRRAKRAGRGETAGALVSIVKSIQTACLLGTLETCLWPVWSPDRPISERRKKAKSVLDPPPLPRKIWNKGRTSGAGPDDGGCGIVEGAISTDRSAKRF